jgi:hypothetical protein
MGDDRVLLILPAPLPDPVGLEELAAGAALLRRLRSFLPVDFLIWPSLHGHQHLAAEWRSWEDVNAYIRATVKPQHHTVDLGGVAFTMPGVGRARSHTSAGFLLNAGTFAAWGEPSLATTTDAISSLMGNPAQLLRAIMQGGDEGVVDAAIERAEATLDWIAEPWRVLAKCFPATST